MLTFIATCLISQAPGFYDKDPEYQFGYVERSAVLRVANYYRKMAGLPLAVWHPALERAARSHTVYRVKNRDNKAAGSAHEEVAGLPGFTGKNSRDRIFNAGLKPARTGENMAWGMEDPVHASESLLEVPYHRRSWVQPGNLMIGAFGIEKTWTVNFNCEVDLNFSVWPPDKCPNVPTKGDVFESPDPMAMYPGEDKDVGYVLTVDIRGAKPSNCKASLTCNGAPVRVLINTPENDRNSPEGIVIIPTEELKPNQEYTATFSAVANGKQFGKTWTFKTASMGKSFTFHDACRRLSRVSGKELLIKGKIKKYVEDTRTLTIEKDYISENSKGKTTWGKQELSLTLSSGCTLRSEYDPLGIDFPEFKPLIGKRVVMIRPDPNKREIVSCLTLYSKSPIFLFDWK